MIRSRPVEVVLVLLIVVLASFYARAEYIPTWADRHVDAAEEKLNIDVGDPGPWFSAWSLGDGQAFAVIASDPSGDLLSEEIKEPVYRFARAGYGWAVALVTFGNDDLIPYGLAFVGAASIVALFLVALKYRDRHGPKAWLLLLNPAVYLGFAGDTVEPMAVVLLALAVGSGSIWAAAVLGVTRPTYVVGLLRQWRPFGALITSAALLTAYSVIRFGFDEAAVDGGRFSLPFAAYIENPTIAGWILVAAALATVYFGYQSKDWAWVAAGVLVLILGTDVTANPVNAWRAAGMLPVLWAFGPGYRPSARFVGDRPPVAVSR